MSTLRSEIEFEVTNSQKPRVLIVEDDAVLQKVFSRFVVHNGWLPIIVSTAEEAFAAFSCADFDADAILMDLTTPGTIDGLQCTRMIRQSGNPIASKIPIIAITARAYAQDKELCIEVGMNDFLSKPCTMQQFSDVVKKWLGNQM